jgi:NADH dehydrogenase (ubiquinone) Fe-S protein 4
MLRDQPTTAPLFFFIIFFYITFQFSIFFPSFSPSPIILFHHPHLPIHIHITMLANVSRQILRSSTARAFSTARPAFNAESKAPVPTHEDNTLEHTAAVTPVELLSGAPTELSTNRIVRIYQQAKPATQSGTYGTFAWRLDWDIVDRANRWENDLIGYASSGDYMQATQLKFDTKDAAVRFAVKNGYDYYVQEPHERSFRPKAYADNFLHSKGKLKLIRTK